LVTESLERPDIKHKIEVALTAAAIAISIMRRDILARAEKIAQETMPTAVDAARIRVPAERLRAAILPM